MARLWFPLSILLLLAIGWIVFMEPDEGQQAEPTQVEDATVEDAPEAAPSLIGTDAEESSLSTTAEVERSEMVLPETGPEIQYGSPVEEGIPILVVDGNTAEPLPFAEVMVIDTGVADMRRLEVEMQSRPDFEHLFLVLGITYRSDQDGRLIIPEPVDDLLIAGRTPTHFNFAFDVDTDGEEITLRLNPVELLPVKVVDGSGRPVKGAPVGLRMRNDDFSQDLVQAQTDEDGIANIKLFDLLKMELGDEDTYVALMALTSVPIQHKVDLLDLPEEMPVLVLPELGQVAVRVVDELGSPVKESYLVDLKILNENEFQQDPQAAEGGNFWMDPREHQGARTVRGVAEYPLVEYGTLLRANVVSHDQERRAQVDGHGPSRDGGKVILEVSPTVDRPVIVGRIVNEEGMAGANLSLESRLNHRHPQQNSTHNRKIKTDGEGRFRMVLEDEYKEGGTRELTVTMRKTKRKPKRSVMVDLSRPFEPGVHDLGDLIVTVPPLLAQGIVLTPDGSPLSGADIRVERAQYYGQNKEHKWWNSLWHLREDSAKDGSFTLRGHVVEGEYRVSARHDDYLSVSQEIRLGTDGVELKMEAAVDLKGRFLFDASIDPEQLEVVVTQQNREDPEQQNQDSTSIGKKGRFRFEHRSPGMAGLILKCTATGEVLFSMEGILLSTIAGADHDLGDIDLRGVLRSLEVTVVDPSGAPIPRPNVHLADAEWSRTSDSNPVQLVTKEPSLDLWVKASGYRSQSLDGVSGDRIVTLQEGIPIRLILTNGYRLPEGFKVAGRLAHYPEGIDGPHVDELDCNTGAGRDEVSGKAQAPGNYLVQFQISREELNSSMSWALPGGEQMVEILDRSAEQVFQVTIPESILEFAAEQEK